MADITARLLWYRLGESSESLVTVWNGVRYVIDTGGTVLNWIFLLWVILGLVLMALAVLKSNVEQSRTRENRLRSVQPLLCHKCSQDVLLPRPSGKDGKAEVVVSVSHDPQKDWLNDMIGWLGGEEYCWRVPITDAFLTSLTQASKDCGGDVFMTFEAILGTATKPNFSILSTKKLDNNCLVLTGEMKWSDVQMSVTSSDDAVSVHSNLILTINSLDMKIEALSNVNGYDLTIVLKIKQITGCDIRLSPYQQGVDYLSDERKLLHHVTSILTTISVPATLSLQPPLSLTEEPIVEQMSAALESGAPERGSTSRPPKPPRSIEDKRLMMKLIKATRLNKRNMGVIIHEQYVVKVVNARGLNAWILSAAIDAYCTVEIDKPAQVHSTSVVKNTVNPYWDEHFLFDLGVQTKVITFRVYREANESEEGIVICLGEARVDLETLRTNHGIRMVLPLESRSDFSSPASGSVTIEGFFVDSAEFEPPSSHYDDVFAQSVEPLIIPDPIDTQSAVPHAANSSVVSSTSDSGSKLIKTTTFVQRDLPADGMTDQSTIPVVEKAEVQMTLPSNYANLPDSSTEVITVYPNQSVTDVVMKEIQDRANKPNSAGHKSTTVIITAASRVPVASSPVSLASIESLSDDGGSGGPAPLQRPQSFSETSRPPSVNHTADSDSRTPSKPETERKSRLSSLKKRFTRTKDKKPRSHSIERSSGLDEHRYLNPPSHYGRAVSSNSSVNLVGSTPPQKKKFGGSLRKLFHIKRRSASSNRANDRRGDILNDLDKPLNTQYDRISIDREDRVSRSSVERDVTPPHRRVLSTSSSRYSYSSQTSHEAGAAIPPSRLPEQEMYASSGRNTVSFQDADNKHYTLPPNSRRQPVEL